MPLSSDRVLGGHWLQLLALQCLRCLPGVSAVMCELLSCLGPSQLREQPLPAETSTPLLRCQYEQLQGLQGPQGLHLHSSLCCCHPGANNLLKLSFRVSKRT